MIYLITGGAGFIGSNFLNHFVPKFPEHTFINIDNLTYAGNLKSLEKVENHQNYHFRQIDIANSEEIEQVFKEFQPDRVVHFAAESHVDRSITGPKKFIETNIIGTFNLLEMCRKYWSYFEDKLFHHVSTDEVFGTLGKDGFFTEKTPYSPNSPYSASKASSDHLVRAYYHTYDLPITITNCSNNYGPLQFPEKLIPLVIQNLLKGEIVPIYGKGENVRDWLYVIDHCEAIWTVIENGKRGETYNIGGNNERNNLEVVKSLCQVISNYTGEDVQKYLNLIIYVKDRPGHDYRYAIDPTKIQNELGWFPTETFDTGLHKTVKWYLENEQWLKSITKDEYQNWINKNYINR
ncbi:dTDP-glucose 4,6-dehydratase [Bacillus sp. WLY-B-L8]|uniref:dTDP-glucose 4,6-dehydratase n=1 Tax=Bacillus multifaciens TaxID=3068506 RepID=UPI0027405EAF|nr:dTDP-glucose 4,6-dehydratase [Bacillus sp. WLY-B-L8]MDP7977687.1 dTDP-glucose 4,6-dehydratase [Bacillus sp. WLY-B-L8]